MLVPGFHCTKVRRCRSNRNIIVISSSVPRNDASIIISDLSISTADDLK